mmetsp:Transcript_20175/g.57689  ORF Transcript_20175/g.57689 Transcript_20175/m.57689 type:complete len:370 (-) Transcript_20175:415-1524(-)
MTRVPSDAAETTVFPHTPTHVTSSWWSSSACRCRSAEGVTAHTRTVWSAEPETSVCVLVLVCPPLPEERSVARHLSVSAWVSCLATVDPLVGLNSTNAPSKAPIARREGRPIGSEMTDDRGSCASTKLCTDGGPGPLAMLLLLLAKDDGSSASVCCHTRRHPVPSMTLAWQSSTASPVRDRHTPCSVRRCTAPHTPTKPPPPPPLASSLSGAAVWPSLSLSLSVSLSLSLCSLGLVRADHAAFADDGRGCVDEGGEDAMRLCIRAERDEGTGEGKTGGPGVVVDVGVDVGAGACWWILSRRSLMNHGSLSVGDVSRSAGFHCGQCSRGGCGSLNSCWGVWPNSCTWVSRAACDTWERPPRAGVGLPGSF